LCWRQRQEWQLQLKAQYEASFFPPLASLFLDKRFALTLSTFARIAFFGQPTVKSGLAT
jgi:hypothetical protein